MSNEWLHAVVLGEVPLSKPAVFADSSAFCISYVVLVAICGSYGPFSKTSLVLGKAGCAPFLRPN